ncbi:PREDICTED: alpha- and gamma-adaptin-binding protein p34 [Nanorana parkeri]|uniref:alpha- and gamma-adaptin-binding protein p34 n=1 Tax=Nanorana parkeri TaxID=125878 RepID=UPI0008545C5F|nr:PREDICTED: alpha- and gamma-adaptin-binding protein p34 [Nanorana parkeri]
MASVPCVLLTSCAAEFNEEELVTQIIGTDQLSTLVQETEGVRQYPWRIDNKYYTALVNICIVPSTTQVTTRVLESVQAFVVYFDSTVKSGLEKVSPWLPLLEDWMLDVMILVCDRVSDTGVSRQTAQEWCIQHGFELVELNPEELPDEDDDFPESIGVTRIVQALNANVWSNVEMKNEQSYGLFSSLAAVNHSTESSGDSQDNVSVSSGGAAVHPVDPGRGGDSGSHCDSQIDSVVDPMLDLDIRELASLTSGEGDMENFGRLFSKLQEMKDKAATLPHEQRKLHAEKVAKAFWMAIGGDRDEIEGISSEDEN